MDIAFSCGACGQSVVIDEAGAGIVIPCPKCNADLTVPAKGNWTDSNAQRLEITFTCKRCNQIVSVNAGRAGRLIHCPKCEGYITVPNASATPTTVPTRNADPHQPGHSYVTRAAPQPKKPLPGSPPQAPLLELQKDSVLPRAVLIGTIVLLIAFCLSPWSPFRKSLSGTFVAESSGFPLHAVSIIEFHRSGRAFLRVMETDMAGKYRIEDSRVVVDLSSGSFVFTIVDDDTLEANIAGGRTVLKRRE